MKSLVTGIAGFAGSHLADLLVERGDEVAGLLGPQDTTDRIAHLKPPISLFRGDITDRKSLDEPFGDFKPERVFHLAGVAHVGGSWSQQEVTFEINVMGAVNVMSAACATKSKVVLVGSAEQYGFVPEDRQPIPEDWPLNPQTPYGASKAAQEVIGGQYHRGLGLHVLLVRAFNHCGARQDHRFVVSDFARQVAEIEAGHRPARITVGNLEARRDFTDVRDMVLGYVHLAEKGRPGVPYNLCSGQATRIHDLLTSLLELSSTRIEVVQDKARYRPSDISLLMGDPGAASSELGWSPQIPFRETLAWTLEYWRTKVQATGTSQV
jgi:GDP-4-dehydro-6-deoxy-D-mannose reductase